jgi:hypothetical protein
MIAEAKAREVAAQAQRVADSDVYYAEWTRKEAAKAKVAQQVSEYEAAVKEDRPQAPTAPTSSDPLVTKDNRFGIHATPGARTSYSDAEARDWQSRMGARSAGLRAAHRSAGPRIIAAPAAQAGWVYDTATGYSHPVPRAACANAT